MHRLTPALHACEPALLRDEEVAGLAKRGGAVDLRQGRAAAGFGPDAHQPGVSRPRGRSITRFGNAQASRRSDPRKVGGHAGLAVVCRADVAEGGLRC